MKCKVPFAVVLILAISAGITHSRGIKIWEYSELVAKSGLIVIARHEKSSDTGMKTKLGVYPVVGVKSRFSVLSVLKGEFQNKTIDIYHYRYDDNVSFIYDGFLFAEFPDNDKSTYLIFLKKDENAQFIAVSGQKDPVFSFKKITDVKGTLSVSPWERKKK